jgi:predicted nucleic acid-binding protein
MINGEFTELAIAVRKKDPVWISPILWESELRNVLMLYIRRENLALDKAEAIIERAKLSVQGYRINSPSIIRSAFHSGCTAYDCEFVETARERNIPLETEDKKVLAAFPDIAVSMKDFIS